MAGGLKVALAQVTGLITALAAKADSSALAAKADTSAMTTALGLKADVTALTTEANARVAADNTLTTAVGLRPTGSQVDAAIAAVVAGYAVKGRYWTVLQIGGARTFQLTDAGAFCVYSAAGDFTVTIPPVSAVAWNLGTYIDGVQGNTGRITFAPGAGVTLFSLGNARRSAGNGAALSLVMVAPDVWMLAGGLIV